MDFYHQLQEAIQSGEAAVARVLAAGHPGLLDHPNEQGISLILLAAYYGYFELAKDLAGYKRNLDIFEATVTGNLVATQQHLAQHPETINAFSNDGFTLLGYAAFFNHEALVDYLLAQGANPNQAAQNAMQVAPLHSAVARKNKTIVKTLLQAGANVNATQQEDVTALHAAAKQGNFELVKILLENGAQVNAQMKDGKTALDFARENDAAEVEKILLEKGAVN